MVYPGGRVVYIPGRCIPTMLGGRSIPTMVGRHTTHHGREEHYPPWQGGIYTPGRLYTREYPPREAIYPGIHTQGGYIHPWEAIYTPREAIYTPGRLLYTREAIIPGFIPQGGYYTRVIPQGGYIYTREAIYTQEVYTQGGIP